MATSIGVQIAIFLVKVIFDLFIGAVVLRLLLGFARADFHNPFSQLIVTVTNPVIIPMRRFLPSVGSIDTAAVLLAYVLSLIEISLLLFLTSGSIHFPASIFKAVGELLQFIIWIYIIALIIQAILSWIGNTQRNDIASIANSLTNPLLRPIRRIVPLIGGMVDLSPMVAILGLNILLIIVSNIF